LGVRTIDSLHGLLITSDRRLSRVVIVILALAAGLAIGAYVAVLSPIWAAAGALAVVGGLLMLRSTRWGLIAAVGVICLLPYAALPFKIGFTPTFLDLVLLAVYFVWIARIATGRTEPFELSPVGPAVLAFLALACASFVAGLAHAALTQYLIRHFAELLLGVGLFFVVVNAVRTRRDLEQLVRIIILAGGLAVLIGIGLYVIPRDWSIRLLSSLGRLGYPTGAGVLRYVEDNPDLSLRAISTSTDPNVLGGLLILITTLTASQLFSRRPLLPRPAIAALLGLDVVCLVLTYSRGAMFGLAVGLGVLALVKNRRLLLLMAVTGLCLLFLPQTQAYVQRFVEGVQWQDLASQMRLGEYKDAFALIGRHPWIGVGFAGTPEISLYLGVSSAYLLMAEEMGLIGLAAFVLVMALLFSQVVRARRRTALRCDGSDALLLGLAASLAGISAGGILDHYFFNLDFPHSLTMFWLYVGLTTAAVRLAWVPSRAGEAASISQG
jgi:hypothetical protein